MYQHAPNLRERALPFAGVVLIHIGLGYGLLHLSGADVELARQADLVLFNLAPLPPTLTPPPPPPAVEKIRPAKRAPKQAAGTPSPKNIMSKATPVVAPEPRIEVPAPIPVVTAITPSTGAAATQGASAIAGPGTGAGGSGTGTGSGGAGNGSGGGGTGGGGTGLGEARARLAGPSLGRGDFPARLYAQAPRGGTVFVILRVGPDGVPLSCRVTRSFGDAELDAATCRLAVERLRFSPGRDELGRPVADFFGYRQTFNTRF